MTVRTAVHRSVPIDAIPEFTPVPRKVSRHDGWTPARQIAFIHALADTGCVAIACRMVNMSQPSAYQLRRQPGAESFRAAWDAAQTLGLQRIKDEAFDRAINGEMIPVFVAGKLMGFRRKKNDRLLMFVLRHYGQDATGRRTTINYFSTRASAGAASSNPPRNGEGDRSPQANGGGVAAADPSAIALAQAEASTTTVKTVISGANPQPQTQSDDEAAATINAFAGVELDAEAQDQIYQALAACAERRRALEADPENDPERFFIGAEEAGDYLGTLESGVEGDWVEYRPEGEHRWEDLGEGGQAEEIAKVLAGIEERKAAKTPEQIEAEEAEHRAEIQHMRDQRTRALPPPQEPDPDDPRLDWRNWSEGQGGLPSSPTAAHPEPVEAETTEGQRAPPSPRRERRPRKPYKKRTPKPAFTEPDEARKAQAVAEVEADRRLGAAAEAERRGLRKER